MSRCEHPNTFMAKQEAVNGAINVGYYCNICGGWEVREGQRGKWLPHEGINLDILPTVHAASMQVCARCKKLKHCEDHHYAPRELFGREDAESWPTGWLCTPGCHEEWHRKIGHPIRGDNG